MIARIQQLPQWQRVLVFFSLVVLVIAFFGGLTLFAIVQSATSTPRTESFAILDDEVSVSEFAALPDDDAYPSALTLGTDGTLYTGSYVSGAVWAIDAEGNVREIEDTRDTIGSVMALSMSPDGALLVLDHINFAGSQGGIVWRLIPGEAPEELISLPVQENGRIVFYDDIAVDVEGNIFISERVLDRIWRIAPDGSDASIWWTSPPVAGEDQYEPAGLAYDASRNAIIVTDSLIHAVYRIPIDADDPQSATEELYRYTFSSEPPGFDGVDVTDNGDIYVSALGQNRVGRVEDGRLVYIAGGFRGASDLAYDASRQAMYVSNWDQYSLGDVSFLFLTIDTQPRLPFAVDVIQFN